MFGRSRSLSLRGFSVSLLVDPFRLDFAVVLVNLLLSDSVLMIFVHCTVLKLEFGKISV